ncbi:MAG: hypothetical protein JKY53_14910 [Flavobacteriales bacterium]|nr:hypothetical protein [Flavobacteriales bacterium]
MTEKSKKSANDRIEELVNQSGLGLEEFVHGNLKEYFHSIRRNAHYLDKDKQTDREIDFLASYACYVIPPKKKKEKAVVVLIDLILECKKAPDHAWIFSGEETDRMSIFEKTVKVKFHPGVIMPEYVTTEPLPDDKEIQEIIPPITQKIFSADGYQEIILTDQSKGKTGNKEPNYFLRKAILQVTKATRHRIEYEKTKNLTYLKRVKKPTSITLTFFQPVIVFEGMMFKTTNKDDKLKISPISFARIEKEYLTAAHNETEGEIHIVAKDYFPSYLKMLKKHYKIMDIKNEFNDLFLSENNREGFL